MSSFLQSKEWAEFQKSLGREVFDIDQGSISANIIKHELRGRNYLFIPFGPVVDFNSITGSLENEFRNFVTQLNNLGHQQKSIFIKVEPQFDTIVEQLVRHGFKITNKSVMPHKTVVIDLQQTPSQLLAAMHHKTRYNIKVAESHGLKVQESRNVVSFLKLIRHTADQKHFGVHPEWYYKKLLDYFSSSQERLEAKLFLVENESNPIAGAIVLLDRENNIGYYLHGASDYRSRSLMAPYLLHWHIIKFLQQLDFDSYDFWGIDSVKWPGVTRFKLGWLARSGGGRQVEYPGSFDLPISKFWYLVYKIYRAIFK